MAIIAFLLMAGVQLTLATLVMPAVFIYGLFFIGIQTAFANYGRRLKTLHSELSCFWIKISRI